MSWSKNYPGLEGRGSLLALSLTFTDRSTTSHTSQAHAQRANGRPASADNIFKLDLNKKIETNKAAAVATSKTKQTALCILVYFFPGLSHPIVITLHI